MNKDRKVKIDKNGSLRIEDDINSEDLWFTKQQVKELLGLDEEKLVKGMNIITEKQSIKKEKLLKQVRLENGTEFFYSLEAMFLLAYEIESENSHLIKQWVFNILKNYLTKGFVIDKKKLLSKQEELHNILKMLRKNVTLPVFDGKEDDILALIEDYTTTWNVFHHWDRETLTYDRLHHDLKYKLTIEDTYFVINKLKSELTKKEEAREIFGQEVDGGISTVIENINQAVGGKDLYPSIEEKAAHILYLTIKDHPFVDGNKRIGSMLFIYFLKRNDFVWKVNKEQKINDNALIALALLVASSDPRDKDTIIQLIVKIVQNDYVR
ncbi:type II toxin-antitoxin system death-on-curing family toxin [Candidatus Dojkabacteria bacterium]|nr:type II toxin-antitoxin system death-on-curing family toxin [Candidatus Dojkabacteria bacterium]